MIIAAVMSAYVLMSIIMVHWTKVLDKKSQSLSSGEVFLLLLIVLPACVIDEIVAMCRVGKKK